MKPYNCSLKFANFNANLNGWVEKRARLTGKFLSLPVAAIEFAAPSLCALASVVESLVWIIFNILGALVAVKNCSMKDSLASLGLSVLYGCALAFSPLIGTIQGLRCFFRMLHNSQKYAHDNALSYRLMSHKINSWFNLQPVPLQLSSSTSVPATPLK